MRNRRFGGFPVAGGPNYIPVTLSTVQRHTMKDASKSSVISAAIVFVILIVFIGIQIHNGDADSGFIHISIGAMISLAVIVAALCIRNENQTE